jgi:hypothetical protein
MASPVEETVGGYNPRYPQRGTWAAPSGMVQLTTSTLAAHGTDRRTPQGFQKI